ncbi:MAG: hypothetical protein RLY86_397 [Pseudomonadota bacterium]|jgi:hypothetical protein
MMKWVDHSLSGWRWVAAMVLLAGVLLRSLIPVGLMPDLGRLAEGSFPLVICAGGMERTIWVDLDGNPVEAEKPGHLDTLCLFGGLPPLAVPLLLILLLMLPLRRAGRGVAPALPLPVAARPPGALSARGPPPALCPAV